VVISCEFHQDCSSSSWVHKIWPRRPAVTLTFYLQNIIRSSAGHVNITCQFYPNCSSCSWDIVVTISDRTKGLTNERTNGTTGQPKNKMPAPRHRHSWVTQPSRPYKARNEWSIKEDSRLMVSSWQVRPVMWQQTAVVATAAAAVFGATELLHLVHHTRTWH